MFHSADNANKFANIAMPANAQIGNTSHVIVAIIGGILAINGIGGFTLGALASFLTFNKSLNMPNRPGQPAGELRSDGACRSTENFCTS